MPTLLGRGELILEVDTGSPGGQHGLHQLKSVERTAKPGFGIGHDGQIHVGAVLAVQPLHLVGAHEGVVDALDQFGRTVRGVEALVRVGLVGAVVVPGHLPAAEVDGLEASLGHLHGLVPGDHAKGVDVRLGLEHVPQLLGPMLGQAVLDLDRRAQGNHLFGRIAAGDTLPTGLRGPALLQIFHLFGKVAV